MDGRQTDVQIFMMRLSYSHRPFVMALPFQKQEAFLAAHVRAFDFFGGAPRRISYDNLTAATAPALRGDKRPETDAFVAFRGHYYFASHFRSPGVPHERGRIENLVGYVRHSWLILAEPGLLPAAPMEEGRAPQWLTMLRDLADRPPANATGTASMKR